MKVLILGGARFVGLRVCKLLVGAGAEVTVPRVWFDGAQATRS